MKSLLWHEAAIFDLDGTLVDSMGVWDNICRDWLLVKGKNPPPGLEADIELMTLTQAADYVRGQFGIALPPEQIIGQWRDMVCHLYEYEILLKPGAEELLCALAAHGLKLALATSCFPLAAQAVLRRYGLWGMFDTVIYTDEVARDKSYPDIWLAAAKKLAVEPGNCVVFEDMYAAGRGIRAAGMSFVAVYDAGCKDWPLLRREADMAVESLCELL